MFSRPLPIARYRFTAAVQQTLQLPDYAGSLLRGQFGAALRGVACMTRQPTCAGCPLLQTCPYSRIFEAPAPSKGEHALQNFSHIPNPYIVEPPAPGARLLNTGDTLTFHLVLVGHAIDQLPLIILALQRGLAQGLTKARVPTDLVQVEHVDHSGTAHLIWHCQRPTLAEHAATLNVRAKHLKVGNALSLETDGLNCTNLSLHITTPLRLQRQSQPLGLGQLEPRALIAAIARRAALLMEFHAGREGWGEAAKAVIHLSESLYDTQDLHWHDWTRSSSRQQQQMTLGGVMGHWTLRADNPAVLATIWPWLWLGQWLHGGKNATMGLGGYSLVNAQS